LKRKASPFIDKERGTPQEIKYYFKLNLYLEEKIIPEIKYTVLTNSKKIKIRYQSKHT